MPESVETWRLLNVELPIDAPDDELRRRALERAGIEESALRRLRIARRSVDARRAGGRRRLRFIVHVELSVDAGYTSKRFAAARKSGQLTEAPPREPLTVADLPAGPPRQAVVVGSGPAGLYVAYVLGLNGARVDLIDRGARLDRRGTDVVRFHRTRFPNPESNLLFGEGGAGTYSDGKLYTRIDDPLEPSCLQLLVDCGADADILFDSRAHIGTDRLHRVLPVLRETLNRSGVTFHWDTRMERLRIEDRRVTAVETDGGALPCDAVFIAPGLSAVDTIRSLHDQGVRVEAKSFQLGVRIEHPQELIDRGRYGVSREARLLGPAYYNLVCKSGAGVAASHSFCMCPGGKIVASVNEAGLLCTNGMSNSMHSSPWANAALVTTFGPETYGADPFDGISFRRRLERSFFQAGGSDYTAPAQRADDFLVGRETANPRRSSYTFGTCAGRIDELLPQPARDAIARALLRFDRQIPGFASSEGLLVGLESRSSCPIRLPRDRQSYRAIGFDNLYPIGEGAGFAGGIMSAAIDGARAAKRWLKSPCAP
ncbi:MAG: NAD(P)-binding protein [Acidobacteria bacterium]|nr:NAD(P)-binding protein [Acidobacteriota bacterium]NIM63275.1 NAD(P)-binding protein [Acidobacteriota bacterium]NIO60847.1 NAD(P)-binding protein [Acidobacteriota bacterium]NIQ31926.1 NAD(P)-binding protein [Acidobacteriota bacterium]NIQ87302.1 NAD(P)-binding protein [Acidobacteriota bacterium]